MSSTEYKPEILVAGGGMITGVQILPSLYHLQRLGLIGNISVCARHGAPLKTLANDATIAEAFPGHSFTPYPDFNKVDPTEKFPDMYDTALAALPEHSIVFIALPDQIHYSTIKKALEAGQHVIAVKPFVLTHKEAVELETLAFEKGLFVGIEYHKRFDDRALMARQLYRQGKFGEFRIGQATMIEPYYYRDSNFMNWCTCENSDMFTYVGCHYVDQVHFITGLLPVEVSVHGVRDKYPNDNEGFLWTDGRVIWENGASLSVIDAMGYPNAAPGGNHQGIRMFCKGDTDACALIHDDQFRGLKYSLNSKGEGPDSDKVYHEPSPDYFKLLYRGGEGLEPVGYGYRSIEALVKATHRVNDSGDVPARKDEIRKIDAEDIIATPHNSSYNELVVEAARMSILNGGRPVEIKYGDNPHVKFREWK